MTTAHEYPLGPGPSQGQKNAFARFATDNVTMFAAYDRTLPITVSIRVFRKLTGIGVTLIYQLIHDAL
jgi:hypothetical protein